MTEKGESYILMAFGKIEGQNARISAGSIFGQLFDAGVWYTTRPSRVLAPGARVLFYQNGAGFRGHAVIDAVVDDALETPLGGGLFVAFSQRISLVQMHKFKTALDPRPLVGALEFISNKKYWGHAFRSTPRQISKKDFLMIIRSAAKSREG